MRQALSAVAVAAASAFMSGAALAGPIAPTLELQALESWHTSSIVIVKGKKTTVITNRSASSGIVIDTAHTGRVEFQTAPGHSFGTFSSLVAIGLGDPLIGSGLDDEVDLSSQLAAGPAAHIVPGSISLKLLLTETGLMTNLGTLPFDAAIGGTLAKGMTLSYQTYVDPSDNPFGKSILLTNDAFPTSGPFSWGGSTNHVLNGQFSVTELVSIAIPSSAAAAGTSFDASLTTKVVPEPGTAAILGLPLGLIAVARRKSGFGARQARP